MNGSIPPVDLRLLHTFYEVARLGSVGAAARSLGRSQPAISHRLRALEDELGVPLFEKVGRRLLPTEHGRTIQQECVELMALARDIRRRLTPSPASLEGSVVVGTLPTVASHLLVPVVAKLLRRFPEVRISFLFDFVPRLVEMLRAGQSDLLMVVGELEARGTVRDLVGHASLVAAMSPRLAPKGSKRIRVERLRAFRYLAWDGPRDVTFDLIHSYALANELLDERSPRIPNIEALRELAAAGAGYTILPAYTVRRDEARRRLVALPIVGLEQRVPLYLVRRARQVSTPVLEHVASLLREVTPD